MSEIQKVSGHRPHTIRYCLHKLQDRRIIRYYPFINVYPFGYGAYSVYFSLTPEGENVKTRLIQALTEAEQVSWLAEIGGKYQYCMTVLARQPHEVHAFLDRLTAAFGSFMGERCFSAQISLSIFHAKFLGVPKPAKAFLKWGPVEREVEIDELDRQILGGLTQFKYHSLQDCSRQLGLPNSTVAWRVKDLQRKGIIIGFVYLIDTLALGMQNFKLLLAAKDISGLHGKLFDFCKEHKHVTTLIECCGSWDFEIGVEIEDGAGVVRLEQDLKRKFGQLIAGIEILPQFGEIKVLCFPFLQQRPFPEKKVANAGGARSIRQR